MFAALEAFFGPQGWWPVTPRGGGRPVYEPGRLVPEGEAARFEIAMGALLTQNTAWKNAEAAVMNLAAEGALSPERVAGMPMERLERLIQPSGYFRQKARKLKEFSSHMQKAHPEGLSGWLAGEELQAIRKELLSIWGIGPETADSILLYAGGRPLFVADAYTLRMGRRMGWFGVDAGYEEAAAYLMERLPRSVKLYNEFHALIVALGKDYCRPRPICENCPAARLCRHKGECNGKDGKSRSNARKRPSRAGSDPA